MPRTEGEEDGHLVNLGLLDESSFAEGEADYVFRGVGIVGCQNPRDFLLQLLLRQVQLVVRLHLSRLLRVETEGGEQV